MGHGAHAATPTLSGNVGPRRGVIQQKFLGNGACDREDSCQYQNSNATVWQARNKRRAAPVRPK